MNGGAYFAVPEERHTIEGWEKTAALCDDLRRASLRRFRLISAWRWWRAGHESRRQAFLIAEEARAFGRSMGSTPR